MKKIPTLYKREFSGHKITGIRDEITPGCEAALTDESIATLKLDGACCAIINGEFYKRFDAKPGKAVPEGAIPCDEPDPVTGHWPHWVKVAADNPADKWFVAARNNSLENLPNATYEAIGPHFQKNPYGLDKDVAEFGANNPDPCELVRRTATMYSRHEFPADTTKMFDAEHEAAKEEAQA